MIIPWQNWVADNNAKEINHYVHSVLHHRAFAKDKTFWTKNVTKLRFGWKYGWSIYHIAKHLPRPYNTIKNEVARGTVSLYRGKVHRCKANEDERIYKEHQQKCRKQNRCFETVRSLQYVVAQFQNDEKWSPDAAFGAELKSKNFTMKKWFEPTSFSIT